MRIKYIIFAYLLCGCTMSVNQVHTEGTASDVVDEQQEASPDISPTLSIPANLV